MADTQPKRSLAKVILLRLAQKLGKGGWALTCTVLVFTGLVVTSAFLWQEYREELTSQSQFRLKAENLHLVTPQPAWIRSNIKQNAITRGRLHDALILDRDLGLRIQKSFLGSPWVKDVLMVNKSSARQSGINVRLSYREPVAMVIVDYRKFDPASPHKEGLLPIDADGFCLPDREFDLDVANTAYPKISNIRSLPAGPAGQFWGDQLVVDAAQTAKLLRERWESLGFRRLIAPQPNAPKIFAIETHNGEQIIWGSPPKKERPDEAQFSAKLARLSELSQLHKIPKNSMGQFDLRIIE